MKTKNIKKAEKTFADQMREIRDNLSLEIKDLTLEQLKGYLQSKKTLHPASVWPKKN